MGERVKKTWRVGGANGIRLAIGGGKAPSFGKKKGGSVTERGNSCILFLQKCSQTSWGRREKNRCSQSRSA